MASSRSELTVQFMLELAGALNDAGEPVALNQARMERIAAAYDITHARVAVLPNMVLAAGGRGAPTALELTHLRLSTNRLDITALDEVSSGIVGAGRTADLKDGAALDTGDEGSGSTISFPELRQYSVFLVSHDAGVPLVLAAAILILVGLLPALYGSRRKVWVRADLEDDGAVLRVGGLAMQRKPQFEEEFARLVDSLASAAGGRREPHPVPEDREKVQLP